jgi:hypothetical protein
MIEQSIVHLEPTFKDMHNIVHIAEKWFYMSKKSQRYYLTSEEEDPLRTCKSKNFIAKVMFLVVTGRPRFDLNRNETFSGKIGIFPFVVQVPAIRNSSNRRAGTLETKSITSVTREIMRSFMIEKVLPAIKDKWPTEDSCHPIFIQQDNARTHIDINDQEFCEAAKEGGFDIRLMCQPPNSPDLNILDLGFFAAIQLIQQKFVSRTIDELVNAVVDSFEAYLTIFSNLIFISLQARMVEIMKIKGCNNYKIPHIKKATLERENNLPIAIKCDHALVQQTMDYLRGLSDLVSET